MNAVATQREQLEVLLAESPEAAARRERETFDREASPFHGRIVLYGAGRLGKMMLSGLRANNIEPVAFADRQPRHSIVDGLPVLAMDEAVRRFGSDAVFVVCVWNPGIAGGIGAIRSALMAAGCRRVLPFVWLYWKFAGTFLPYYLWDLPSRLLARADEAREAFALFDGPRSQAEFLRHLELRLSGDFDCLAPPVPDAQYFPEWLFSPRRDECFVDCGAYDGDSLRAFADWTGGRFRSAWAFEADPVNFRALESAVAGDARLRGRVRGVQAAVGSHRTRLRFAAEGLASSAALPGNDASLAESVEVDCLPLDEALGQDQPTYIKMDIEGAELDALHGASGAIRRHAPLLATCAYHTQDHLWLVPALMHALSPESRLLLRPHCPDGFDLVCYGIPPDRLTAGARQDAESGQGW